MLNYLAYLLCILCVHATLVFQLYIKTKEFDNSFVFY